MNLSMFKCVSADKLVNPGIHVRFAYVCVCVCVCVRVYLLLVSKSVLSSVVGLRGQFHIYKTFCFVYPKKEVKLCHMVSISTLVNFLQNKRWSFELRQRKPFHYHKYHHMTNTTWTLSSIFDFKIIMKPGVAYITTTLAFSDLSGKHKQQ